MKLTPMISAEGTSYIDLKKVSFVSTIQPTPSSIYGVRVGFFVLIDGFAVWVTEKGDDLGAKELSAERDRILGLVLDEA